MAINLLLFFSFLNEFLRILCLVSWLWNISSIYLPRNENAFEFADTGWHICIRNAETAWEFTARERPGATSVYEGNAFYALKKNTTIKRDKASAIKVKFWVPCVISFVHGHHCLCGGCDFLFFYFLPGYSYRLFWYVHVM